MRERPPLQNEFAPHENARIVETERRERMLRTEQDSAEEKEDYSPEEPGAECRPAGKFDNGKERSHFQESRFPFSNALSLLFASERSSCGGGGADGCSGAESFSFSL